MTEFNHICSFEHPQAGGMETQQVVPMEKHNLLYLEVNKLSKTKAACYGRNCVLPNLFVEVLTPNVTVFGDRAIKEIIKVK